VPLLDAAMKKTGPPVSSTMPSPRDTVTDMVSAPFRLEGGGGV
jgi:hypothetical protein